MNKYIDPRKYLNHFFYNLFLPKKSYSQVGEDLILNYFLGEKKTGFYVDVGANHPKRFSNTNLFYKKGWTGINIEPDPICFRRFLKSRKRDINLNCGVGESDAYLDFYMFRSDTISTFSKDTAEKYISLGYKFLGKQIIEVKTLEKILDEHASKNQSIDFFSIDTEGFESQVLKSNDWQKFRPKIVVLETLEFYNGEGLTIKKNFKEGPSFFDDFFVSKGYKKIADTYINSIYMENNFAEANKIILK